MWRPGGPAPAATLRCSVAPCEPVPSANSDIYTRIFRTQIALFSQFDFFIERSTGWVRPRRSVAREATVCEPAGSASTSSDQKVQAYGFRCASSRAARHGPPSTWTSTLSSGVPSVNATPATVSGAVAVLEGRVTRATIDLTRIRVTDVSVYSTRSPTWRPAIV